MEAPQNLSKKLLSKDSDCYNISQLSVKYLSQLHITKDKNSNPHQNKLKCSQIYKGSLYIYVISTNSTLTSYKIHDNQLQLQTFKQITFKEQLQIQHHPCSTLLNDEIYLFGIKKTEIGFLNFMQKLNLITGKNQAFSLDNIVMSTRQNILFQTLNNSYIVIYGGRNLNSNKIQNDAFIFLRNQLKQLNVINPIQSRISFATVQINGKIYLHGGKTQNQTKVQYLQHMYEIKICDFKLQFNLKQLKTKRKKPRARCCHSMTSISNRYIALYGGQTNINETFQIGNIHTLSDCWIFDIYQQEWNEVQIMAHKSFPKKNFIMQSDKNKIIIFGGQNHQNQTKNDAIIFSFPLDKDQKNYRTNQQINRIQASIYKLNQERIQLTMNLIHNISYSIKFPFQAIQKIVQYAQILNSKQIKIYSQTSGNTLQRFLSICFEFDGIRNLQRQHKTKFQNIPFYCLRLGKTILYVQNDNRIQVLQRRVLIASADGKFSAQVDNMFIVYEYVQDLKTGLIKSKQGARHREIIINILNTMVQSPLQLISSVSKSKIIIFSPNIIPTARTYYYELIFDQCDRSDLSIFKNNKKIEHLQKLNYPILKSMEYSLKNYLTFIKCKQLNTTKTKTINIYLNNYEQSISNQKSYKQILQQYCQQNKIYQLQIQQNDLKFVKFCKIYLSNEQFILPENNGILIYQNNRLINRYNCNFGQIMAQKFYKKKISNKPSNLFQFLGQIHVSNQLKLHNFDTQLQKDRKYLIFEQAISSSLEKAKIKFKKSMKNHQNTQKRKKIDQNLQFQTINNKNSMIQHLNKIYKNEQIQRKINQTCQQNINEDINIQKKQKKQKELMIQ